MEMQLEYIYSEFKYTYDDLKRQIKEIASLPMLLKLTEKSTKKLECLTLYAQSERRELHLELVQKKIMQEIIDIRTQIKKFSYGVQDEQAESQLHRKMQAIKNRKIQDFEKLNQQEELLSHEIQKAEYLIPEQNEEKYENQIKEEDESEEEVRQVEPGKDRVEQLKDDIDKIDKQIIRISNGRGKWLQSDHADFIKIYNRYAANGRRLIEEAVKTLAMTSIEIMDHLELYEKYLQLSKEKKAVAEEYREIQLLSHINQEQNKAKLDQQKQEKMRVQKTKQIEQSLKKKQMIKQYKQNKVSDKIKLLQQQEKIEIDKKIKMTVPPAKRKEIIERNHQYIQDKTKHVQSSQPRQQSQNKAVGSKHGRGRESASQRKPSKQPL